MFESQITSAQIFYFTGTNNALKTATWIQNTFQHHNIQTQLVNIAAVNKIENTAENPNLIGICSPTHGFNFPPIVLHFLFKLQKANKNQSAFIVNTRAGMKMGKIFLPGLSGITQLLSALILLIKGYRIVGMRPIDMPSNWISIHPGIKEKVSLSILNRCKKITIQFAEKLAHGKKDYYALRNIIQDVAIAPISLGYYFVGRYVFAKSFYANRYCTICFKCMRDCPVKAIKKIDNRPYWTHQCESCMRCMNTCPVNAIQTAHGFVVGIFYLSVSLLLGFVWNIIRIKLDSSILDFIYMNGILKFTLDSVLTIFVLLLAYRIMHYLLKFSTFERIISATSFTTYRFWRRFKIISSKII